MDLKDLFKNIKKGQKVTVQGWIKNHRKQKEFGFIDFSDGTSFNHLQIVYDNQINNFDDIQKMLVGCAIEVEGEIVESQGNQDFELKANKVTIKSLNMEE